jgi:hypothetical protein
MGTKSKGQKKHAEGTSGGREFYDPMAITWMDKYSNIMDKIWSKLPSYVGSTIVTLAVFTLGATMRGMFGPKCTDKLSLFKIKLRIKETSRKKDGFKETSNNAPTTRKFKIQFTLTLE